MPQTPLEMLATLLQRGKSTFWCLQDCCKHFQKHIGRYSALSKTFFRDKEPHSFVELTFRNMGNKHLDRMQPRSIEMHLSYPPQSFLSRVVPLSGMIALRKLSCPSQIRRFPSLAIYVLATRNALKPKFISCLHLRDRK